MVYTVFEVLNSRGLPVAWLDRLKSSLMAKAFEAGGGDQAYIKELHTIWSSIYRTIGMRQAMSSEALRFAATLKSSQRPNKVLGEEDAVETKRLPRLQ